MKKYISLFLILSLILVSSSFAFLEALPADFGSNAELMEVLNPELDKVNSSSETYLLSCLAEPDTEITVYKRLDRNLYVPMTVDNEAISSIVGASGMFMFDITFEPNSVNDIVLYAEKDGDYQTVHKTIIIKEEAPVTRNIKSIKEFVLEILK